MHSLFNSPFTFFPNIVSCELKIILMNIFQLCIDSLINISSQEQYRRNIKVLSFRFDLGSFPLSKGSGASIKTSNYTRPGSCIETDLPQKTITSPGPVNWDSV